jgi:hypothetical protein
MERDSNNAARFKDLSFGVDGGEMKPKLEIETTCAGCGMPTSSYREYHPWAVCELFKATRNSTNVRINIRAVIEYGMKAERAGVSVDAAMRDFNLVFDKPAPDSNSDRG